VTLIRGRFDPAAVQEVVMQIAVDEKCRTQSHIDIAVRQRRGGIEVAYGLPVREVALHTGRRVRVLLCTRAKSLFTAEPLTQEEGEEAAGLWLKAGGFLG
jgi:hypothetical protein